jgi:hypothetical protein
MTDSTPEISFFSRLALAFVCFWRVLLSQEFARAVLPVRQADKAGELKAGPSPAELPARGEAKVVEFKAGKEAAPPPPEREHASALQVLAMLQREGRLIDFLQEEVAPFADADVGAAARIIHEGCRKVVKQYLKLEPVLPQAEGDQVQVPSGFDAQRIRLTGNVAGEPPYRGSLKHHGWVVTAVNFPTVSPTLDPRVLAPAEVDLP